MKVETATSSKANSSKLSLIKSALRRSYCCIIAHHEYFGDLAILVQYGFKNRCVRNLPTENGIFIMLMKTWRTLTQEGNYYVADM